MRQFEGKSNSAAEQALVQKLKQWQAVEDDSIRMTKEVQSKIRNPLVRLVMEIIAHDSVMHRRVQQFIIDAIQKNQATFDDTDDLDTIRDVFERHVDMERSVIAMAKEAKESTDLFVPRYLFNYLLEDERKHDLLLDKFEEIGM